jgi:hypothetical protein
VILLVEPQTRWDYTLLVYLHSSDKDYIGGSKLTFFIYTDIIFIHSKSYKIDMTFPLISLAGPVTQHISITNMHVILKFGSVGNRASGRTPALHSISHARASTPPSKPAFRVPKRGPCHPDDAHVARLRAGTACAPLTSHAHCNMCNTWSILQHPDEMIATYVRNSWNACNIRLKYLQNTRKNLKTHV